MDKISKMLSGEELLDKGVTKKEVTLPILGYKDVTPNGSWLEQKQIQSALEARKHLVEAQRIEKRGILSQAVWCDELKLAEVTKFAGSYWQFLGHLKGKKTYLRPEEALYLMEVNCLLLTYEGIVVSLQQAYSLLLRGEVTLDKYKVYAYLSRLGYKLVLHESLESSKDDINEEKVSKQPENKLTEQNKPENIENNEHESNNTAESNEICNKPDKKINNDKIETMDICDSETRQESEDETNKTNGSEKSIPEVIEDLVADIKNGEKELNVNENESQMNIDSATGDNSKTGCKDVSEIEICNLQTKTKIVKDPLTKFIEWKLEKLKERQSKMRSNTNVTNHFENIPDLSRNRVVTIKVPKEEFLPKNIFLNNLTYVINTDSMASKNAVTPSPTYSTSDEVNGEHVRRVTNSTPHVTNTTPQNVVIPPFYQNVRQNVGHRTFQWRPRPNLSYFQFNLFFQRPFMTNFNMPRFQFYPRTHFAMFPRYFTNPTNFVVNTTSDSYNREEDTSRKRKRVNTRKHHLEAIKNLAQRLRQLVMSGNLQTENLEALQRLIDTYNVRYRTKVRLTDQYEIINDETIIETIELDDDEQTKRKRRRVDDDDNFRDSHFNRIRQIASNLKQLDRERKASARHRRALSNLIKTYNKCYNADIYINANNELLDRLSITLDSSSESESVPEKVTKMKTGKKLRNPFNILKRLSEKQIPVMSPTTSKQECSNEELNECNKSDTSKTELLGSTFCKNWSPNPNDFGRPEVLSRDNMNIRIIESKKEEYLYEFLKDKPVEYSNWIETKIGFLENTEKSNAIFRDEAMKIDSVDMKSIIKSEDCTDMRTVLKKLNIIKINNSTKNDVNLAVDFDVYNRDVQNFRKTSKPTPHFRVVCLSDTAPFPSGIEISSLHAKYKDDVLTVFAIVGSSSISFIQMNPTDSPVYTSSNF